MYAPAKLAIQIVEVILVRVGNVVHLVFHCGSLLLFDLRRRRNLLYRFGGGAGIAGS
jgi:hypothetical protein